MTFRDKAEDGRSHAGWAPSILYFYGLKRQALKTGQPLLFLFPDIFDEHANKNNNDDATPLPRILPNTPLPHVKRLLLIPLIAIM